MVAAYEEDVASFDKIDSAKAQELIKGEGEAVIYIGKAVCPYCQLFIKKLKKVAEEMVTHITEASFNRNQKNFIFLPDYWLFKDLNIPRCGYFTILNGDLLLSSNKESNKATWKLPIFSTF